MGKMWGRDLRGLGDDGGVDAVDLCAALAGEGGGFLEDLQAADAADRGIGVGEVMADVLLADGAEHGVGDGVAEDVGIGMTLESAIVRNLDAAEDERASFDEAVDVVAEAGGGHRGSFKF